MANAGLTQTPDIPVEIRRAFVKVSGLVVLPEMRRQCIGRALVRELSSRARQRGAAELQFNVYEYDQEAMAFFRALGFAPLRHRLYRTLETDD